MRALAAFPLALAMMTIAPPSRAQTAPGPGIAREYGCNERTPPGSSHDQGGPLLPIARNYDGCAATPATTNRSPPLALIRTYDARDEREPAVVTLLPAIAMTAAASAADEDDRGPIRVVDAPPPGAPTMLPEIVIPSAR